MTIEQEPHLRVVWLFDSIYPAFIYDCDIETNGRKTR
jgi:hypothetical protein